MENRDNVKNIAEMLKVLANENRLMIICALISEPMTVSKIAEKVQGISQPALSQHLAVMKARKILGFTKSGQNVVYFIIDSRVEEVMKTLRKYYCD